MDKQIEKANKNLQTHLTNIINGDSATNGNILEDEKLYQRVLAQINELNKAKEEIQTEFDIAGDIFDRSIGDISKPSGGSSSGSSSSTNKEIDDIEVTCDWYLKLNNAIDDNNRLLEQNRNLQEHANGTDKIKLMKQEVELMKQQAQAQQNLIDAYFVEVNQAKDFLKSKGFLFDAQNNLINSTDRLIALKQQVNKLSGSEKEYAIAMIKLIEENIKRFTELTNSTIPGLQGEIEELNNSIKDVYQDQLDLVADTEKEIYDVIEYYANKTKEAKLDAIEEQIDALEKLYDLEDREDALQILHESRAYARELLEYKVDVKLGVLEILQFLKQNHIKIAVATSTPKSLTIKRLRYLGLVDYFDAIFCGDDVKYRKPHPEIYLKAIKYFNVSPQDAIVIEDSPSGVEAAFRADIPCIMVPDLIKAGKKQEQQTKYIAKSLLDVIEYMKHVL